MTHQPHDPNRPHHEQPFDPSEPLIPRQHAGLDPDKDSSRDFELDPEFVPEPEPQPRPYPLEGDEDGPDLSVSMGRHWHPDEGTWGGGLMDVRAVSRRSGYGVSTLYRWVRTGRLRQSVITRSPLRFDWDELMDELRDHRWRD